MVSVCWDSEGIMRVMVSVCWDSEGIMRVMASVCWDSEGIMKVMASVCWVSEGIMRVMASVCWDSEGIMRVVASVCWVSEGILLVGFLERGATVNSQRYVQILKKIEKRIRKFQPKRKKNYVFHLHENARLPISPVHKGGN